MAGVDGRMDDGNAVRIASIADDDPPYVRFSLGQATAAETAAAEHVEIGDTFALGASTSSSVFVPTRRSCRRSDVPRPSSSTSALRRLV